MLKQILWHLFMRDQMPEVPLNVFKQLNLKLKWTTQSITFIAFLKWFIKLCGKLSDLDAEKNNMRRWVKKKIIKFSVNCN